MTATLLRTAAAFEQATDHRKVAPLEA